MKIGDEILKIDLPAGFEHSIWEGRRLPFTTVVNRNGSGGGCTIDWERREARGGLYVTSGKPLDIPRFAGRGWQRKLLDAVVAQLRAWQ